MKKKNKYVVNSYWNTNDHLFKFLVNSFMVFIYFIYWGIPIGIIALIVYGIIKG
jgi:hypothetical protein